MLSLNVDDFLTRILPRRPSTVSASPSDTVKHANDGLSYQKQNVASSDREPRKPLNASEQSSQYPYSHRPRPLHIANSSSISTTPSIETSETVPTPKSNDRLPDFMASPTLQLYTVHYGSFYHDGGTKRVILTLDEPSSAIDSLLCLAYPEVAKPEVKSTQVLCDLLALCQRYNMAQATHYLCSTSLRYLACSHPLGAYSIACRFNLKSEIPFISRETLRVNLSKADLRQDLAYCTPHQVERLVKLHKRRGKEAIRLIGDVSTDDLTCRGGYCEDGVAEWWLEVVKASRYLLLQKPTAEVLFSPEVLAECCRRASLRCSLCPISFLSSRSQHRLAIVKIQVDSLACSL